MYEKCMNCVKAINDWAGYLYWHRPGQPGLCRVMADEPCPCTAQPFPRQKQAELPNPVNIFTWAMRGPRVHSSSGCQQRPTCGPCDFCNTLMWARYFPWLGQVWPTSGIHMGLTWRLSGKQKARSWHVSGIDLEIIWLVCGINLAIKWLISGKFVAGMWH